MSRFWSKVTIRKDSDCWLWSAAIRGNSGYGAFRINGKIESAHRVSYFLTYGDIPGGKIICHTCDN